MMPADLRALEKSRRRRTRTLADTVIVHSLKETEENLESLYGRPKMTA